MSGAAPSSGLWHVPENLEVYDGHGFSRPQDAVEAARCARFTAEDRDAVLRRFAATVVRHAERINVPKPL